MLDNKITVHMVVKNEDIFIWYAISSVLPYVSQIIIFDTGSGDKTVDIIKSYRSTKIIFEEKGNVNPEQLSSLRYEQIKRTKTDWFWVVDGDEIYPQITIREILDGINQNKYLGAVVRRYDLLGDIYHFQDETIGEYTLFGEKGHLVLRLLNKKLLPGLHLQGLYPYEGYYDNESRAIIDYPKNNFFITQSRLFHAMYLKRSTLGSKLRDTLHRNKYKIEKGHHFPLSEKFPEVFFAAKPKFVPNVTHPRSISYELQSAIITPIKKLKRKIW